MPHSSEHAFETFLAAILDKGGSQSDDPAEWVVERALFPAHVFAFLEDSQPKLWGELRALHGAGLEPVLLAALV